MNDHTFNTGTTPHGNQMAQPDRALVLPAGHRPAGDPNEFDHHRAEHAGPNRSGSSPGSTGHGFDVPGAGADRNTGGAADHLRQSRPLMTSEAEAVTADQSDAIQSVTLDIRSIRGAMEQLLAREQLLEQLHRRIAAFEQDERMGGVIEPLVRKIAPSMRRLDEQINMLRRYKSRLRSNSPDHRAA